MSASDGIFKPKRKFVNVPIHKPETDKIVESPKIKKTYSANFSSRRKHKYDTNGDVNRNHDNNNLTQKYSEVVIEIPQDADNPRKSTKLLKKEVSRLNQENEELVTKFNELEELSVQRILKLKEKVSTLQNLNTEFSNETTYVKQQYNELLKNYDNIKRELEIKKVCKKCSEIENVLKKVNEEKETVRKNNIELCEDLHMLKTVVYRLNLQLERYQEKLRKHNLSIEKYPMLAKNLESSSQTQVKDGDIVDSLSLEHRNHKHAPLSWGSVNSHTLGPLLDAYQDTINEKEEIIQDYELELSKFTGKLKQVTEENETLYKKLTDDQNCSSKLSVQIEKLEDEVRILKDHNDALIKKCALKQDKIEEILKTYENKVEQMKRDYNVVHEEYIKIRTENAALREKNKSLVDAQDDFRNERHNYIPVAVHTASVNECKKWYEELKLQYESEKLKLKENLDSQKKVIEELTLTTNNLKKTKEDLEGKIGKLEKELKKAEAKQLDLEHSLNEVQLSRSACRKQLHKTMCFARDMVQEQETLLKALNQRQLENKAVKKIGSEMALRMDSLKSQLKDVQKSAWHEFNTVEQKIQEQTEIIETMKEEHEKELEKLQKVLVKKEKELGKGDHIATSHFQLFKEKYK